MSLRLGQLGICISLAFFCLANSLGASGTITFKAGSVESSYEKNNERTVLRGNASVTTNDLTITAGTIEILGASQRWVLARDKISVVDKKRNIVIQGNELSYDRENDIVKVKGNAMLEDFDNKVVIRSGLFEYRMKEEIALMNTSVKLFKDDVEASAESASWKRETSALELMGSPSVVKGGDTYKADSIRLNTKTDEILLSGSVKGSVADKKDKKSEDQGP